MPLKLPLKREQLDPTTAAMFEEIRIYHLRVPGAVPMGVVNIVKKIDGISPNNIEKVVEYARQMRRRSQPAPGGPRHD